MKSIKIRDKKIIGGCEVNRTISRNVASHTVYQFFRHLKCWILILWVFLDMFCPHDVLSKALVLHQQSIHGEVRRAEDRRPLRDAIITVGTRSVQTDEHGRFVMAVDQLHGTATIRHIGYQPQKIVFSPDSLFLSVFLEPLEREIEEVKVSTGYYKIGHERSTGSFEYIDTELLQRNQSGNILERLEGVTSALQFGRAGNTNESRFEPEMRIRGVSSIMSNTAPLIIVDDFPFDGDINAINPNDVESVTVLKDAAASSIWGARAGNGVIVITTNKPRREQPLNISLRNSIRVSDRPNLFYNPSILNSAQQMEIESMLFDRNFYNKQDWIALPDYVSLLFDRKEGNIDEREFDRTSSEMMSRNVNTEARRELYQPSMHQQHSLTFRGGGMRYSYLMSASSDEERGEVRGNKSNRKTLRTFGDLELFDGLNLTTDINYAWISGLNNGITLQNLRNRFEVSPYTLLRNVDGSAASIPYRYLRDYIENAPSIGLLDWEYRPLEERELQQRSSLSRNFMLATALTYKTFSGMSISARYQYQRYLHERENQYDAASYYARDLVNQFTQTDFTRPIPEGGIRNGSYSGDQMHNLRLQMDYERDLGTSGRLVALGGAEVREHLSVVSPGYQLYGYNDDVLTATTGLNYERQYPLRPNGNGRIPSPPTSMREHRDRFVSYYGNFSYDWKRALVWSGSVRWDASNLFGVDTNQKGVPLWSTGVSYNFAASLLENCQWIDRLNLRSTYGRSGNVNNTVSVYPTTMYINSPGLVTNLPYANLRGTGNPNLRWEQISTTNIGLDFSFLNGRLSGNIEYYNKKASDLIGENNLDPTTGISRESGNYLIDNRINYADLNTYGYDFVLNSINTNGSVQWISNILLSYTSNTVVHYMANSSIGVEQFVANPIPVEGRSLDALYAYPFGGLSADDGMLLTPAGDQDYNAYVNSLELDDLLQVGFRFPPYHGSMRNTVSYRNWKISANMEWKAGFHFRKQTINYNTLFNSGTGNSDFYRRWQKSGDESLTDVPAIPQNSNMRRDHLYAYSTPHILRGDFIRLSDIQVSYDLNGAWLRGKSMRFFAVARNVGILYRANRFDLDPDLPHARYPIPRSYTIGLHLEL